MLEREIAILKSVLPQTLDPDAIVQALQPLRSEIMDAKSDGQATGVAMKHLKAKGQKAQGQDVAIAVQNIRKSQ